MINWYYIIFIYVIIFGEFLYDIFRNMSVDDHVRLAKFLQSNESDMIDNFFMGCILISFLHWLYHRYR